MPQLKSDLARLVAVPSISAAGYPEPTRPALLEAYEEVVELCRDAGVTTGEPLELPGTAPVVIGAIPAPAGAPTVLLYSHYDVVPVGDESKWQSPPFEATELDGAIYARARQPPPQSRLDVPRRRLSSRARDLRRDPHEVAARGAPPRRAATGVGTDPVGGRSNVPRSLETLPRARAALHPARRDHLARPVARPRRLRPPGSRDHRRGSWRPPLPGRRRWDDADPARARPRPGGDSLRTGRDRRRAPDRPARAYRIALTKVRPLVGGLGIAVLVWLVLNATTVLIPIAIWLTVRWLLLAQVVVLEDASALGGLRRSSMLVRGHWLRIASLVGVGASIALAIGPLLGTLLIVLTDAPLPLLNIVAGVVYALAMPFVALATTYAYFDVRAREEIEREHAPAVAPAEIALGGWS